jgi:COP9 signalosome complex subunit 4
MADLAAQLDAIEKISTHAQKVDEYKKLAERLFAAPDMGLLTQFLVRLADDPPPQGEAVPTMISRQVLQDFSGLLFAPGAKGLSRAQVKELGNLCLAKLRARLSSFEEQFSAVSEKMADILQDEEDWKGAAELLSRIPLTSSQRNISDEYKAKMYVRIAMLYLEDDDETNADVFVGRSHVIIGKSEFKNLEVKFQHQACRARIYDAKRKFQDAARHYYELSQVGKATIMAIMGEEAARQANLDETIEAQNLDALTKASICAILAPAGPERSRILAMLYKDERTQKIAPFNMLQKIYMERVVRAPEIKEFETLLRPHQMALTADGLTVLQKAMIEHNLFAAAKMYNNITFVELGFFLHVDPDKAEKIARNMILEERMAGSIDQIDGMIYFAQVVHSTNYTRSLCYARGHKHKHTPAHHCWLSLMCFPHNLFAYRALEH